MTNSYLGKLYLSILAGASIALGGIVYLSLSTLGVTTLGCYCFSIGLLLVLFCSLWLFTGKIGHVFEKQFNFVDYLLMFVGNFIGAAFVGFLCYFIFGNSSLAVTNKNLVEAKLNSVNYFNLLLSGIWCGMFVYLSVECFKIKKLPLIIRVLLVIALIGTFVLLKLNHCIANMFYFSLGVSWNLKTILFIVINTLGNSLGAIVLNTIKISFLKLKNERVNH